MLIIAHPKSASSSLIKTVSDTHGIRNETSSLRARYVKNQQVAEEYRRLAKWHTEFIDVNKEWADATSQVNVICKHHFPPTAHNCRLFHKQKKIILLREPEDIVLSYFRGDKTGAFPLQSRDFVFCRTQQDWLRKAKDIGLLQELRLFAERWRQDDGHNLYISYDQLVNAPEDALNSVESFFNLPLTRRVSLSKEKYSREKRKTNHIPFLKSMYVRAVLLLKSTLEIIPNKKFRQWLR